MVYAYTPSPYFRSGTIVPLLVVLLSSSHPCMAQESGADTPAGETTTPSAAQREQPRVGEAGAPFALYGRGDGPIEVRNSEGEVIEVFPIKSFRLSGQVSFDAIDRISAEQDAQDAALAERKAAEREEADKALEARKQAEALEQKVAEEREAQWKADFAAKSDAYKGNRRDSNNVKAVKIDARQIREDGTYLYEGRQLKPIRLWSTQRKRWEMAIPVENP